MQKIKLCRNLKIKWEILQNGSAVTLDGLDLTLILVCYSGMRKMAFSTDKSYVVCVIKDSEQLNPGEYWFALYQNYATANQSLVSVCDHFELVADSHCCDSAEATIGGDSSCNCGPALELGVQGDSAYETWLKNGHEGSEEDYLAWLQQPADEAAEKADAATQNAIQATADTKAAIQSANEATAKANVSASTADVAALKATDSASTADSAADSANTAALNANKMAESANESASNANTATQEAKDATAKAIASAESADESAAYAKEQGDYAKSYTGRMEAIETSVTSIQSLIPNTATSDNQLADKEFVNSSITTNTATFKGTFETADDLPTTDVKANDYAFIIATDSTGNPEYQRYKYADNAWAFEYTLNNSSFTAEQWAAITSGITASKISSLEQADTDLQSQITTETEARTSADTALRTDVDALKDLSIAKGTGSYSLVLNYIEGNIASGMAATAEGMNTTASSKTSHSEGFSTKAIGFASHSEGEYTQASAETSHSEGYSTKASGIASHSEGYGTQTATKGGHSQGVYNEDDTNALHTIGIGTSDTARKNSEIVYTSGKKYLYGVGGYDGTKSSIANGAKSIQEVLSSIKTEEWTFTLEDGSTVTKNMCYES